MKAIVKEIQVCGGHLFHNLAEACIDYLECLEYTDREKIHFTVFLSNGKTRGITIRQEDNQVVAYGDFDGLPDALEYAQDVCGKLELKETK